MFKGALENIQHRRTQEIDRQTQEIDARDKRTRWTTGDGQTQTKRTDATDADETTRDGQHEMDRRTTQHT